MMGTEIKAAAIAAALGGCAGGAIAAVRLTRQMNECCGDIIGAMIEAAPGEADAAVTAGATGFLGMWHSHPDGRAWPSPTDEQGMHDLLVPVSSW